MDNEPSTMERVENLAGIESDVASGEPYLGQMDTEIKALLDEYPEFKPLKIQFSHLHRTTNYNNKQAMNAWIDAKHIIRMYKARYSGDPELEMVLENLEAGIWTIIMGDGHMGKRQKYLQTQRREYGVQDMTEKTKRRGWF